MSESVHQPAGENDTPPGATSAAANAPSRRTGNSILCPVCERLNALDLERCDRCGGELFIDCRRCGARNPRVNTRCSQCQHRFTKLRRTRAGSLWLSPIFWVAVVTGIGIVLALILLVWLGGGKLPSL